MPEVASALTYEYDVCVTTEMPPSAIVDVYVLITLVDDSEVVEVAVDVGVTDWTDTVEVDKVVSSDVVGAISSSQHRCLIKPVHLFALAVCNHTT